MSYPIDLVTIERSWEPNWFVKLMESNPITNLFWRVLAPLFGYDNQYRCNDWSQSVTVITHYRGQFQPTDPNYPRYYRAVQRVLSYNPHLRSQFIMTTPPRRVSPPLYPQLPLSQQSSRQHQRVASAVRNAHSVVPPPTIGTSGLQSRVRQHVPPPTVGTQVAPAHSRQQPIPQQRRQPVQIMQQPLSQQRRQPVQSNQLPLSQIGAHRRRDEPIPLSQRGDRR